VLLELLLMKDKNEILATNKKLWDYWASLHPTTEFYNEKKFLVNRCSLHLLEKQLLGDVKDKDILHLQCHFGQDTLSLADLGARVIGVDFSSIAIDKAKKLKSKLEAAKPLKGSATFVESDVLALNLDRKFDIIFTSYGVLPWLPNLGDWATVIQQHLRQNGKLVLVEFHPFIYILNDSFDGIDPAKPYSSNGKPIERQNRSYTDKINTIPLTNFIYNHSLGTILEELHKADLIDLQLKEYDYSSYNCFPNMEKIGEEQYRNSKLSIPLMFSIIAARK